MTAPEEPRLSRKKAATRERICHAARGLFAQQGYSSTSVEQIAKVAGTRRSTLYTHFRDKDEILGAMTRDYLARVKAVIGQLPSPAPTRSQIDAWIVDFTKLAESERASTIVLMQTGGEVHAPQATRKFGEEMMEALGQRLPAFAQAVWSDPAAHLSRAWARTVLRELGCALSDHARGDELAGAQLVVAADLLESLVRQQAEDARARSA